MKEKDGKQKKHKQMDGPGAKLGYSDLNDHLIKWNRLKLHLRRPPPPLKIDHFEKNIKIEFLL